MSKRHDPAETPADGRPDHSKVEGKKAEFQYLWAHKDDVGKLTTSRSYKSRDEQGKEVAIHVDPFAKCRSDEEDSEEFGGYGSIRGGNDDTSDIVNGELVLLKRPASEHKKVLDAQERINAAYEKRIHGDIAGKPIRADITETVSR